MLLQCNRFSVLDTADTSCEQNIGCAHHCRSTEEVMHCACRHGYRLHANGKDCIRKFLYRYNVCLSTQFPVYIPITVFVQHWYKFDTSVSRGHECQSEAWICSGMGNVAPPWYGQLGTSPENVWNVRTQRWKSVCFGRLTSKDNPFSITVIQV